MFISLPTCRNAIVSEIKRWLVGEEDEREWKWESRKTTGRERKVTFEKERIQDSDTDLFERTSESLTGRFGRSYQYEVVLRLRQIRNKRDRVTDVNHGDLK